MKIMIIASAVWDFYARHTPLCEHLARRGHQVIFVEPIVYADAKQSHLVPRTSHPVPKGVTIVSKRGRMKRGLVLAVWQNLYYALQVINRRPDAALVVSVNSGVPSLVVLRLLGIPALLDYIDDWPEWSEVPWESWLLRHVLIPSAAWLADVCLVTARLLATDIAPYARRIAWLPNGAADMPPPLDEAVLLPGRGIIYVGGLAPRIDINYLIDLAQNLPEVSLTIIGGGVQLQSLQAASEKIPNLHILGQRPHEEAMCAVQEAAICLIPYRQSRLTDRCFPIKLVEYWAHAKPVVATRCHEIEVIGKGVVQFADSGREAASVCRKLLENTRLCHRLGRAGHKRAQRYNYHVISKKLIDIILRLKKD